MASRTSKQRVRAGSRSKGAVKIAAGNNTSIHFIGLASEFGVFASDLKLFLDGRQRSAAYDSFGLDFA